MNEIPTANNPREVLCFLPIEVPTSKDGDVYLYMTKDVYSKYLFFTGAEQNTDQENVLKHVRLLMEDETFKQHQGQPFTLVFHKFEELRTDIEAIIQPHNGAMAVSDLFITREMIPIIEEVYQRLSSGNSAQEESK